MLLLDLIQIGLITFDGTTLRTFLSQLVTHIFVSQKVKKHLHHCNSLYMSTCIYVNVPLCSHLFIIFLRFTHAQHCDPMRISKKFVGGNCIGASSSLIPFLSQFLLISFLPSFTSYPLTSPHTIPSHSLPSFTSYPLTFPPFHSFR